MKRRGRIRDSGFGIQAVGDRMTGDVRDVGRIPTKQPGTGTKPEIAIPAHAGMTTVGSFDFWLLAPAVLPLNAES
jgi:hypothetical protein